MQDKMNGTIKKRILADIDGKTLTHCFSCGTCTGTCPSARIASEFNPRRLIHRAILNHELDESIWLCANCYMCEELCPTKTDITHLINLMKRIHCREKGMPEFIKPTIESIEKYGYSIAIGEIENKRRERIGLPIVKTTDEIGKILKKIGNGGYSR